MNFYWNINDIWSKHCITFVLSLNSTIDLHPSIYNFYDQGLLTLLTLYNKIVVQTYVRVEVSAKSRIFYTSDITILGVHKKKLGFFFFFFFCIKYHNKLKHRECFDFGLSPLCANNGLALDWGEQVIVEKFSCKFVKLIVFQQLKYLNGCEMQ